MRFGLQRLDEVGGRLVTGSLPAKNQADRKIPHFVPLFVPVCSKAGTILYGYVHRGRILQTAA